MEAVLPPSTSRQLARRRREPRAQRQEEQLYARVPDRDRDPVHRLSMAVVPGRAHSSRVASWTSAVKAPHQLLKAKAFGYSSPYEKPSQLTQRGRASEVSAAPKNRHHQHHKPSGSGHWLGRNVIPVKAKVDSHWFKPHFHHHHHRASPAPSCEVQPGPGPCPGVRKAKNKSLAGAHEELELMLTRIERARDYLPPPPPSPAAKRRNQASGSGGAKADKVGKVGKVAKGVRRHMGQPPPVPPGSPMNSARRDSAHPVSEAEQLQHQVAIPLVHNPQRLAPAKRDALLELLQRTEQHDRGIVDIVRSAKGGSRSSRDTMRMMLQVLPLSLSESPYNGRVWIGHGSLKERQEMHQKPRPVDELFPEPVKTLSSTEGQVFRSHSLTQEPRDEKQALVLMDKKIQGLTERQEQAMRERAELEQHKQRVTVCREQRRQREHRKHLAEMRKRQRQHDGGLIDNGEGLPHIIRLKDPLAPAPPPIPNDPWKVLLQERDRFLDHCQRSYFYNNSRSPAPWKIYAKVASKLSSQLMDIIDNEYNCSPINYVNN